MRSWRRSWRRSGNLPRPACRSGLPGALQAQGRGGEALAIGLDGLDDRGPGPCACSPSACPMHRTYRRIRIDPDAPPPAPLGAAGLWLLRRQAADLFAARGDADASAAFARAAAAMRPPPGREWVFLRGDGSVFRVAGPEPAAERTVHSPDAHGAGP